MTQKRVSETYTRMAQMMTPNDANIVGSVFGGSILALIDLTAAATAQKFSGEISVTASFDRVDFHEPIRVGELVELDGHVSYVGRTSLEVTIEVHSTNLKTSEKRHSNTARVTMVAIKDGKPFEVPRLVCETKDEKRQFLMGKIRREMRAQRIRDLAEIDSRLAAAGESELDAMMQSPEAVLAFLKN
jgi:acyl-CoA hydrolase